MRSLPLPNSITALELFRLCNSRLTNSNLKGRMKECEPLIEGCDVAYQTAAIEGRLYALDRDEFNFVRVSKQEMINAYSNRLAHKDGPGRRVYEDLRLSAEICPLCNEGVVAALDHFLPKAEYTALALNPNNLVPICSDCNKAKLNFVASRAEDQALHPYYDRIDDVEWLKAEVLEEGIGVILFKVVPPTTWSEVLAARVWRHFEQLRLGDLYSKKSVAELSTLHYELEELLNRAGHLGVQASLSERARGRSKHMLNSWQSAMYTALAESEWYCSGGFRGASDWAA